MVYIALSVLFAFTVLMLVVLAISIHSDREDRSGFGIDAELRAMEESHRAAIYGNAKDR